MIEMGTFSEILQNSTNSGKSKKSNFRNDFEEMPHFEKYFQFLEQMKNNITNMSIFC